MNLGHKQQSKNLLGVKGIVGSAVRALGHKAINSALPQPLAQVVSHTADGIINNYSNSADVAKEPIKGTAYKQSTSRPPQIEKHRRQRSNSDAHKYA